ncbi:MAG: ParB N-terminal domain-containing protein [Cyanobacteria bacterium P01_G01_bin.38]
MAKKRDASAIMARMATARDEISKQDERSVARARKSREQRITVPLSHIQPRDADTRPLNAKHVADLKESIATLGLIEPLVVDEKNILLAGAHRLAAIQLLEEDAPSDFKRLFPKEMVPVRAMAFSSADDPERALQVEVAENEHRRDYTPAEVKVIADHLKAAGYVAVKGRPRKGQKPLMPALSVVIGKNLRTVQRYLNSDTSQKKDKKSTTDVVLFLEKASNSLKKWQKQVIPDATNQELLDHLPEILQLIETTIEASDE